MMQVLFLSEGIYLKKKVLHLEEGMNWRGGQNQILSFVKLNKKKSLIENFIACPDNSVSLKRFSEHCVCFALRKTFIVNLFYFHRLIKVHKINVLIAHTSKMHMLGVFLKLFNKQIKLIVFRKINKKISQNYFRKWKYTTSLVDSYIVPSETIRATLEKVKGIYGAKKINVIKDIVLKRSIDLDWVQKFKDSYSLNEKKLKTFVTTGFLDNQKNHIFLIRSLAILKKTHPNFKLFIAGSGPLRGKLSYEIKQLGLEQHVFLLGFIGEVSEILELSDVFIFPSINEGLGSSLLDAILHDCLLVGADSGGVSEIIINKKTGFLFSLESQGDLVEILKVIMDEDFDTSIFLKNAKLHLNKNFNAEKINNLLVDIYLNA